jgi:hypothetical protein
MEVSRRELSITRALRRAFLLVVGRLLKADDVYNKLFSKIVDSSIWLESDATRIVWLTMIAVMDEDGFVVMASIENLARRANVSVARCSTAVAILEAPDPNSADPDNEGRRIERVPGGWVVLNAAKHRLMVARVSQRESNRRRVTKHREKGRDTSENEAKRSRTVENETESSKTTETASSVRPPNAPRIAKEMHRPPPQIAPCNAHVMPCNADRVSVMQSEAEAEARSEARSEAEAERTTALAPPTRDDFDEFWEHYPKKTGKAAARREWERAKNRPGMAVVLHALLQQKQSMQWLKDGGQFIPNPATWIHQGRWDDRPMEIPQVTEKNARSLGAIYGDD